MPESTRAQQLPAHVVSGRPCDASAAEGEGCAPDLSASAAASSRCTRMSGYRLCVYDVRVCVMCVSWIVGVTALHAAHAPGCDNQNGRVPGTRKLFAICHSTTAMPIASSRTAVTRLTEWVT